MPPCSAKGLPGDVRGTGRSAQPRPVRWSSHPDYVNTWTEGAAGTSAGLDHLRLLFISTNRWRAGQVATVD
jgi:hypothetical protein